MSSTPGISLSAEKSLTAKMANTTRIVWGTGGRMSEPKKWPAITSCAKS
jgi:hypothetical protein